ncbi:hypothetical protein JF66_04360 [Cryobacterium sp. MLB-32]|nr:DUF222 domain-containing protein [Cryobacterium sp. MLB-32]KFF60434.1 hypothetical protein JF66_04360 [Cryobacterium sp. MLB-32]
MSTTQKSDVEVIAQLELAEASMAAALAEVNFTRLNGAGSLAVMAVVEKIGRRVDGVRVLSATDVAARADSALGHESLAYKNGCRGKYELITGVTRVSSSEAKRRMRLGGLITGAASAASGLLGQELPVQHPAVAQGLASGELGVDAAEVIVTALEPLARRVAPDDLDRVERALVASATGAITPETEGVVRQKMRAGGFQNVILGENGEVLHLGEKKRFFTPSQRRAIAARDGGCVLVSTGSTQASLRSRRLVRGSPHHPVAAPRKDRRRERMPLVLVPLRDDPHLRLGDPHGARPTRSTRPGDLDRLDPSLFDPTRTWRPAASHRANTPSRPPG